MVFRTISIIIDKNGFHKTVTEHKLFLYGALSDAVVLENKRGSDLKLADAANVIEAGRRGEYGNQRVVVTLRQHLKYLKESGMQLLLGWTWGAPSPQKRATHILTNRHNRARL